jgi:hypothetical protein
LAQILRQKEESYLPLLSRLLLNPEILDFTSASQTRAIFKWVSENILNDNVLTVENWLEVAYHLCKQRWDSSVDWLEEQPMSKVQTMIQIVKNHAEAQEKAVKRKK